MKLTINTNIVPYTTNYHTHSDLCDGKNSLEDMAEAAFKAGIKTLGFSGHGYTDYDKSYCMSLEDTAEYIRRISALKEKYAGRMNILTGIEQDFGSKSPVDGYDYVIGSVHALFRHGTGADTDIICSDCTYDTSRFYYVDWSLERLENDIRESFGGDPYAFSDLYYEMVSKLPEVTHCDIIGHFDLITKFIEKEAWIDVNDKRYINAQDKALAALLDKNVIFEINTGAISRGYRSEPYPSARILEILGAEKTKVVINSDSHSVDTITYAFDRAYELAERYHLNLVDF